MDTGRLYQMNEKIPKIRFKGFYEEWNPNKLDECVEFYSGLTYTWKDNQKKKLCAVLWMNLLQGNLIKKGWKNSRKF